MNKSIQVYIVTKGSYSDYGILGAFLDKSLAEEFAKQNSDQWESANVEEWDADKPLAFPPGSRKYRVMMDEEGNSKVEQYKLEDYDLSLEKRDLDYNETEPIPTNDFSIPCRFRLTGRRVTYVITDMGEEGAVKIANERRIVALANGTWPIKGAEDSFL